ncbi:DUF1697 domain-containing protein [Curtobacterium sp. RRHDQ10]|uniref:DUF1697 domain-containing protein n=1 Tax=Curtobacterium phyllosphaerae TaxID=3413379 RepID=UPI003BF0799C
MTRWVALLRGVNVNGVTIRSADLAALFRGLGYTDVRTVLASGNVVFTDEGDAADGPTVRSRIERALAERFGYDAWIVLVEHDRLAGLVDAYPFPEDSETHAYVVFTSDPASRDELLTVPPADVERIAPGDGVVYWACPKGSSTDTPFARTAARARYRSTTTTRNANTLRKMLRPRG